MCQFYVGFCHTLGAKVVMVIIKMFYSIHFIIYAVIQSLRIGYKLYVDLSW